MDVTPKILTIDDAEFVQHLYRVSFRKIGGCTLHHAYNGMEALNCLDREGPMDLIILDLNMPIMDGLQFLAEFKKRPDYRATHVLVSSTEDQDGLIRQALENGAQSFIKKPFTLEQFVELLGKVLASLPKRPQATPIP